MANRFVNKTYRTYLESIKRLLDCIFVSSCLKFNNLERSLLKREIFQILSSLVVMKEREWSVNGSRIEKVFSTFLLALWPLECGASNCLSLEP